MAGIKFGEMAGKCCILILAKLNLAIWNCTCDVIILRRDVIVALLARCVRENGDFEVVSCIQGYHVFESILNPTTGEELNCVQERANTEDPYTVAVIHRSAVEAMSPERYQPLVCYS